jgi:hypothetical protein
MLHNKGTDGAKVGKSSLLSCFIQYYEDKLENIQREIKKDPDKKIRIL